MSVIYDGIHSVMFIKADNSIDYASLDENSIKDYFDTWNHLHLIPESRPLTNTPQPSISLYSDSVTSTLIDLTDKVAGGQIFGPRQGEWSFIVDHDKWDNWYEAKNTIEKALNGQKLYCILSDDTNTVYCGRFVLSGWNDGEQYSTVTIGYDLNNLRYVNRFQSFLVTDVQIQLRSSVPTVYVGDPVAKIRDYVNAIKTYMDGSIYTLPVNSSSIENANVEWFDRSGENIIDINYNDKTYPLSVMVDSISLSFIEAEIREGASSTIVGEQKSSIINKINVYATYSNGMRMSVSSYYCNVESGVFSTYGTVPVSVSFGNKSTTVNVTVVTISGITATLDGSMEGRIVGDSCSSIYDHVTLTGIYTDQSTFNIYPGSSNVVYSPDKFTQAGSTTVTITYLDMHSTTISVPVYTVSSIGANLNQRALRLFVGLSTDIISEWRNYSVDDYYNLSNGTRRYVWRESGISYDSSTFFTSSGNKTIRFSAEGYYTNLTVNVENVSITSITATTSDYFNTRVRYFRVGTTKRFIKDYCFDYTILYSDGQTQVIKYLDENYNPTIRGASDLIHYINSDEENGILTSTGAYVLRLKYLNYFSFNVTIQVESQQ